MRNSGRLRRLVDARPGLSLPHRGPRQAAARGSVWHGASRCAATAIRRSAIDMEAPPPRRLRGIRRSTGLIGDDSWFDRGPSPPAGGRVSSSRSRRRCWRSSSTAALSRAAPANPPLAAASLFRRTRANGIAVAGGGRSGVLPPSLRSRPPLGAARGCPQVHGPESDNYTAEVVLKRSARSKRGGKTAAGVRVRRDLKAAGVPLTGVRLADGSGLSRLDRVTASELSRCSRPGADATYGRLPRLARRRGYHGTLEGGWRAARREDVSAKTGTTRRLGPLRLRREPLRLRDRPERRADRDVLGAARAGPVRHRARRGRLGLERLRPLRAAKPKREVRGGDEPAEEADGHDHDFERPQPLVGRFRRPQRVDS